MTLGDLIKALEQYNPNLHVPIGFSYPHSYRGYYEDLAFEPVYDVTIGSMLDAARSALGATFEGYKGGSYTMGEHTQVWIAEYGRAFGGEVIGPVLLAYMTSDACEANVARAKGE